MLFDNSTEDGEPSNTPVIERWDEVIYYSSLINSTTWYHLRLLMINSIYIYIYIYSSYLISFHNN